MLRMMNIKLNLDCLTLKNEPDYTPFEEIELSFQPLLDIKRKEGFNLNIELSQRHIRISVWRRFIDILRPIVLHFDNESANVNIVWSYNGRGGDLFDEPIPFSKQVQCVVRHSIQQPRSDWEEDLIQYLDRVRRMERTYKAGANYLSGADGSRFSQGLSARGQCQLCFTRCHHG